MRRIPNRTASIALAAAASLLGLVAGGGCAPDDPNAPGEVSAARSDHDHDHNHDQAHGHGHGHHHDEHDTHAQVDPARGGGDSSSVTHDHASLHPSHDPQAPCTCATAKLRNHWCQRCNAGYVAGHRVENARLFETVDPHGHHVTIESLDCESCQLAARSDGFCDACRVGFVNRVAYFTRLTHGLAQGQAIDPASLTCAACQAHAASSGWCEPCNRGMVGNVALANRATFDRAAEEYQVLLTAIDRVGTCELCACAMVVHTTCPRCRISYARADSHPRPEDGPAGSSQKQ